MSPPPLESQLLYMKLNSYVLSWILNQVYPIDKRSCFMMSSFFHMTHVSFTNLNEFLLTSAEFEKWPHHSTSFVRGVFCESFKLDPMFSITKPVFLRNKYHQSTLNCCVILNIYRMVFISTYKFWSVNSGRPYIWALCACLEVTYMG